MLARFSTRALLVAFGLGVAILALGLLPRGAGADCTPGQPNCEEVPSQGTIGGGTGIAMTIECKWELPDMSPGDAAMTYVDATGNHDDTPSVYPSLGPCNGVCLDNNHHMMGITPNPDDGTPPGSMLRQYEKWVAVESSAIADIIDVYWDVWEPYVAGPPNGPNCTSPVSFPPDTAQFCFKYQHHATATRGPISPSNPLGSGGTMFANISGVINNCADLAAMTGMLEAAKDTGQMTQGEIDAMILRCGQGEKAIFRVQEDISKEQPYGEYRVQVTVVNSAPQNFTMVNYFDVLPFIHIRKDFTGVDWQTINNGMDNTVSGNHAMETPAGTAYANHSNGIWPTIENVGNQEMLVNVHFDPLVLGTKVIDRFDTKFQAKWKYDLNPLDIQDFPLVYASHWVCFDQHPLGSNQTGKIDFSVHPIAAGPGTYTGTINILGTSGGLVGAGCHP